MCIRDRTIAVLTSTKIVPLVDTDMMFPPVSGKIDSLSIWERVTFYYKTLHKKVKILTRDVYKRQLSYCKQKVLPAYEIWPSGRGTFFEPQPTKGFVRIGNAAGRQVNPRVTELQPTKGFARIWTAGYLFCASIGLRIALRTQRNPCSENHQHRAGNRGRRNGFSKEEPSEHQRKENAGVVKNADLGGGCKAVSEGDADLAECREKTDQDVYKRQV